MPTLNIVYAYISVCLWGSFILLGVYTKLDSFQTHKLDLDLYGQRILCLTRFLSLVIYIFKFHCIYTVIFYFTALAPAPLWVQIKGSKNIDPNPSYRIWQIPKYIRLPCGRALYSRLSQNLKFWDKILHFLS